MSAARLAGVDPDALHPLPEHPRVVHLAPLARGLPRVEVGRHAYYDDPVEPERFFERNVLHHFEHMGDRLVIGPFCAIATGARIVMNGANHDMAGFSTYPFDVFGWGELDLARYASQSRGDTVVGPDVWIGAEAWLMPGVTIGAGAIVAARSIVTSDVPPYAVAAGNPARPVRRRFDEATVARLVAVAWWDWEAERITRGLDAIRGADLAALEAA